MTATPLPPVLRRLRAPLLRRLVIAQGGTLERRIRITDVDCEGLTPRGWLSSARAGQPGATHLQDLLCSLDLDEGDDQWYLIFGLDSQATQALPVPPAAQYPALLGRYLVQLLSAPEGEAEPEAVTILSGPCYLDPWPEPAPEPEPEA